LYVHGDTRAVLGAVCNVPSIKHRFLLYIQSLVLELADPRVSFYGFRSQNVRQSEFPFRGKSAKLVIPPTKCWWAQMDIPHRPTSIQND
jgi:hypothetical protein